MHLPLFITTINHKYKFSIFFVLIFYTNSAWSIPITFFSDLDSAPVDSFVTVWGKDFGNNKGSITVGSSNVTNTEILSWSNNKIEFRVPQNGGSGIRVTDAAGSLSNTLSFSTRTSGNIYFVSRSGSDSNNGSLNNPWKTVSKAINSVAAGDVVYFRSGLYNETMNEAWSAAAMVENVNGSAASPIAFASYPGETATIGRTDLRRAFNLQNGTSYWTLSKLHLIAKEDAILYWGDGTQMRFIGNTANNLPIPYGVFEIFACDGCKIYGNSFDQNGINGNKLSHAIYYGGFGVGKDIEVAWNTVTNHKGGRAIQFYGHDVTDDVRGVSIHDNILHDIALEGILLGGSDASTQDWIKDAIVYNNVIYNAGQASIFSGGIRVDNPGINAKIYHNTVHNSRIGLILDRANIVDVKNNIFSASSNSHMTIDGSINSLSISNNFYESSKPANSSDSNAVVGNPLFVNPGQGNFGLQATSPALDKGATITPPLPEISVPNDQYPDLGAQIWAVSSSTPTNSVPIPSQASSPNVSITSN